MFNQSIYPQEFESQKKYKNQNIYEHIQNTERQNKKTVPIYQPEGQEYIIKQAKGQINNQYQQNTDLNNLQKMKREQEKEKEKLRKKCCLYTIWLLCCIISLVALGIFLFQKQKYPYSPQYSKPPNGESFRILIMGTNDLNGKVYPTKLFRPDTKQPYNYGGLATLLTLRNIVAKKYDGNFLYLDAGDSVVGGIQSSSFVSSGQIMNDFFKCANLTASTVGDSDFGLGPQFSLNYLKGRQTPNLVSNLIPMIGGPEWVPNKKNSMIVTMLNGIKIGLIGILTISAKIDKLATIVENKTSPYQILDYTDIVLNQSKSLRAQGANLIILVAHEGNNCYNNLTSGKWTNQNQQKFPDNCNSGQIFNIIDKLPNNTIDLIVQGHSNTTTHKYYRGIPIMGTIKGGYYVNFIQIQLSIKDKKLIKSSIEGPVSICQKVFENTRRCDYVEAADIQRAGKLIPWKFHGVDVTPNEQFNQLIKTKWDQKMTIYRDEIVVNTEIIMSPVLDKENQLGNLFTNLLKSVVPDADFVILDPQIFRSQWFPGPINYELFYNMFPFNSNIISFMITGDGLVQSCKSVNSLFFSVWNLQPIFQNQRRKGIEPLPSLFSNGTKMSPTTKYKGVTVLLSYNSKDIFYNVNEARMTNIQKIGDFREKVKPFLKQMGTIKKGTLIDPQKPRAIVRYID